MSRNSAQLVAVWALAAFLVVVASLAGGYQLNHTATRADEDRLQRGADAVKQNLETEIQTLQMVIGGVDALATGNVDPQDLEGVATAFDPNLLTSIVALVSYPVTDQGVVNGEVLLPIRMGETVLVPDLNIPADESRDLIEQSRPFLSPSYEEEGQEGVRMVAVVPTHLEGEPVMVGAIFLVDQMLSRALFAVGRDEYAATIVDMRFDGAAIATAGSPSSDASVRVAPIGLAGLIDVLVSPGQDFPYASTPRTRYGALVVGVTIALLLLALGWMTWARGLEMERRLRLADEHDRGKDRFLATVSHELRTPLTVVIGAASELNEPGTRLSPEDRSELLGMVVGQATEAATIVEDLLVAARSEYQDVKMAMAPTSLQEHLQYAAEWIPAERRQGFTMTTDDPMICADATRVRQILRNLLQNAVRHGGPSISVEATTLETTVQVSVFDDGPDIGSDMYEHIFEPYAQSGVESAASTEGVGLGLYISRLLARLMGGDLVCLRTGDRTELRLTLPTAGFTVEDKKQPAHVT